MVTAMLRPVWPVPESGWLRLAVRSAVEHPAGPTGTGNPGRPLSRLLVGAGAAVGVMSSDVRLGGGGPRAVDPRLTVLPQPTTVVAMATPANPSSHLDVVCLNPIMALSHPDPLTEAAGRRPGECMKKTPRKSKSLSTAIE